MNDGKLSNMDPEYYWFVTCAVAYLTTLIQGWLHNIHVLYIYMYDSGQQALVLLTHILFLFLFLLYLQ